MWNKGKKILFGVLSALMVFGAFAPLASATNHIHVDSDTEYVQVWDGIFLTAYQESIWRQLLSDFDIVNNVESENEARFTNENQAWLDEVNTILEHFLQTVPSEHHYNLMVLLVGGNPLSRAGQMSNFFSSHSRARRNGFTTYTLRPTFSTRTFRATAANALETLRVRQWNLRPSYTAANRASLQNQFWCHFDFDFETFFFGGTWDLEVERPNVGLARTILALCNP